MPGVSEPNEAQPPVAPGGGLFEAGGPDEAAGIRGRLLHPVVAVCLAEVDGTSDAVGEESRAGQIALRFDLYAPPAAGTGALQQVLSGICRTLLDRRVCAVSAGAPQADTYTGCLHLRATLTYREDLEDGDGEYERTG